jgi:uncharacterized protein YqeY
MRARMRADLTAAVKARVPVAIAALRSALAAIENAEAVPLESPTVVGAIGVGAAEAERRQLSEEDVRAIVDHERRDRLTAAQEYERLGRNEVATRLRAEAAVLETYLPA